MPPARMGKARSTRPAAKARTSENRRGAAVHVDVFAVGRIAHHRHLGAQGLEHALGQLPGGAIGAVQAHAQALIGVRSQRDQVADIAIAPGGVIHHAADALARGQRRGRARIQKRLGALDHRVLHLFALGVDKLEPVIPIGIVAGADHHAAVKALGAGHIGHAGRGGDVQQVSVRAGGGKPCAQRILQHIAGGAGILADDHARAARLAAIKGA